MPLAPIGAVTRFGTVWPGTKLRFDAGSGRVSPDGQTVAKPAAVGLVAVTLSTTAVAPTGTPVSVRSRVTPGPQGVAYPGPLRESRMRDGASGWYRAPLPPPPVPSP